jgi:2,4-dienoyl-CoA reductase-like NADH-dependent reductase (Old Yellow Enzyme family)
MAALFKPGSIGPMKVKNRFVQSAAYESMALESGEVTDQLVERYRTLARGGIGLIIPGYMFVHPLGRSAKCQSGIHEDRMIPGLRKLVEAVHQEGGKVVFQLAHGGRQTTKALTGDTPVAPSSKRRDPIFMAKPREMSERDISLVIRAFADAARRSVESGADGVQIHAAHGYLISQFLSPFFNKRRDQWGGSDVNRFRILREIIVAVRDGVPKGTVVMVKLNTNDYTPRMGTSPPLAAVYAKWLNELGVEGLELSCGTLSHSIFHSIRGDVPVDELVTGLPWWKKIPGKVMLSKMKGKYDLLEGYNLDAAGLIKPKLSNTALLVVGGFRTVKHMEQILAQDKTNFISMCRPFIREPFLVKKIKQGKTDKASCISCNRCFAAVANNMPLRCYVHGFASSQNYS